MGNLQTILDFVARVVPDGDVGAYCRSGDTEVQVQEKANGEREVVVLRRLASIDMSEFEARANDD